MLLHPVIVTVLVDSVTAASWVRRRPLVTLPGLPVIAVCARTFPVRLPASVAELPTW